MTSLLINIDKNPAGNFCFDIVCDFVELPFRINFLQSRKLKGYQLPQHPQMAERFR